jgi:hypothetical protein
VLTATVELVNEMNSALKKLDKHTQVHQLEYITLVDGAVYAIPKAECE